MTLVLADRVRETTTTVGTGALLLAGAVTGFQSFSAIGDGNTTFYGVVGRDTNEWEVGVGTYSSGGTTLVRTTVLSSSNSGSVVAFSAGTKDVFCTQPAAKALVLPNPRSIYGNSFDGSADLTQAVAPPYGGSGVVNGANNTITFTGNYSLGITLTAPTSVTFPTSGALINSAGTAAKATVLATPRTIYGSSFDGSAALTGIIPSTYGGTGNGFTKFTGPTSSEKVYTLPDASSTLLYSGGDVGTPASGTLTNCTGLPQAGLAANVAGNGPAFLCSSSTTQSITAATLTKVLFQTHTYDTHGVFVASKFTPTVAGFYQFNTTIAVYTGVMANSQIHFYKNGVSCVRAAFIPADMTTLSVSTLIYCNGSTDYIEVYFKNVNACVLFGGSDSTINFFSGFLARSA